MAVTKPDATVFDSATDSIATSRAELYTMATSFNTIADDYNAGNLGGGGNKSSFGSTGLSTTLTSTGTNNVTATNGFSHIGINTVSTNAITINLNIDAMDENEEYYALIEPFVGSNHGTITFKFSSSTDSWTSASFTPTVITLYSVQKFGALQTPTYTRLYAAQQLNNIDSRT